MWFQRILDQFSGFRVIRGSLRIVVRPFVRQGSEYIYGRRVAVEMNGPGTVVNGLLKLALLIE